MGDFVGVGVGALVFGGAVVVGVVAFADCGSGDAAFWHGGSFGVIWMQPSLSVIVSMPFCRHSVMVSHEYMLVGRLLIVVQTPQRAHPICSAFRFCQMSWGFIGCCGFMVLVSSLAIRVLVRPGFIGCG